MSSSNQTQRVLLSEQFVDDLFYTATATSFIVAHGPVRQALQRRFQRLRPRRDG